MARAIIVIEDVGESTYDETHVSGHLNISVCYLDRNREDGRMTMAETTAAMFVDSMREEDDALL
jgi:hypothetical protein